MQLSRRQANKQKKEEELAAAAHQQAMADVETAEVADVTKALENTSLEGTASSSSTAPPPKQARTEAWQALKNPAKEVIGDGT